MLRETFEGKQGARDELRVFWLPEGVLLSCHSYTWSSGGETTINDGNFYYNWRPRDPEDPMRYRVTSSGGWRDGGVWAGDHNCREGLRFHLAQLREHGEFVMPWKHQPFLWLNHYMDDKRGDRTRERLRLLPVEVRAGMGLSPEPEPES